MSQISRPFQIALLVVGVLALVWLFVLQGRPASTSTAPSSPVVSAAAPPSASSEAKSAAAPSSVYHGAAPGVEGLTRAIAKAHGAVATSQKYSNTIEQKSAQASAGSAPAATTGAAPTTGAATKAAAPTTSTHAAAASPPTVRAAKPSRSHTAPRQVGKAHSNTVGSAPKTQKAGGATHSSTTVSVPKGQRTVEAQLANGNVVALLFWNPNGSADAAVQKELKLLVQIHHKLQPYVGKAEVKKLLKQFGLELDKKIAMDVASAAEVAEYGTITRGVQVYDTPTLLIVNKKGQTIVMNGLQDAYSIQQTIDEARNSS